MEELKHHNQMMAVVMFAVAIFTGCLVLIPGENVWNWLHSVMLGLFGNCAISWPILLLYISIVTAIERPQNRMGFKVGMIIFFILFICAALYIFSATTEASADISYWEHLKTVYVQGMENRGSGFFGCLIGFVFVSVMGGIGSKIVIILLLFVMFMILTGTSLIQLFRTVTKPVAAVSENLDAVRERRNLEREMNIDISLEKEELPAHPVHSARAPQKPKQKSPKLEQLEKVFNVANPIAAPAAAPAPEPTEFVPPPPVRNPIPETPKIPLEPEDKQEQEEPVETEIPSIPVVPNIPAPSPAVSEAAAAFLRKTAVAQPQPQPQAPVFQPPVIKKPEEPQLSMFQDEPPTDGSYRFPPVSMLESTQALSDADVNEELQVNGQMLVNTLKSFGVQTKIMEISRGPAVTRYELQPAAGVKISKITNLADDIAMNLAASGVRIEAPIPGKAAVGIEVPNKNVSVVRMRELIESNSFVTAKSRLTVALGRDIAGSVTVADLAKMPHLLIAGSTGSGKSVCINSLIISLLYKANPDEVRFLMVDPKVVELGIYNGVPHLLVPVVTDPRKAAGALGWAVTEMLNRYKIFAESNVRDLASYNKLAMSCGGQTEDGQPMPTMPQIVIIIDELADLMMAAPNEVEDSICRLAQMARAAGMHLVIATQRPSVDVITGIIKANIPSRIAFAVSSQIDSRTILDMGGAEKLLGRGDMLFSPVGSQKPIRIQGCFVSDSEIESIVTYVKKTQDSGYDEKVIEEIERNAISDPDKSSGSDNDSGSTDPMMQEAIKCVVEAGQASTSLLQRRLRLGYARAGRLIDEMEQMGVVGPHEGSKPRQVLLTYQQFLEMTMQQADREEQ